MKKQFLIIALALWSFFGAGKAQAQADEAAQLLLNVEKLAQFKQILSDMKKGYQILSSGYNTIKDISEGNFSLHKSFLDGLMQVSPSVRKYRRIADIINLQVLLVQEYQMSYGNFRRSANFTSEELGYLGRVYQNLLKESLRNIDELTVVITAGQLRMTDDERIQAIDRIYADMQDKVQFLRNFNNNNSVLVLQRTREKSEVERMRAYLGVKK